MSFLDKARERVRPGSRGMGPISQTSHTRRSDDERLAPRTGMSAPGAAESVEGKSWPIALVREVTSQGRETVRSIGRGIRQLLGEEGVDPPDPDGWGGGYEADNREVLAKLFRLEVDD